MVCNDREQRSGGICDSGIKAGISRPQAQKRNPKVTTAHAAGW